MAVKSTEQVFLSASGMHERAPAEIAAMFLSAQQSALKSLEAVLPDLIAASEVMARVLENGGRFGYAGAGSSGLMAMADALELAGTFSIPPESTPILFAGGSAALLHMQGSVEDDRGAALHDLETSGLTKGDALVAVSASGTTPYALAVAEAAKAKDITVIGVANAAETPLLQMADIAIFLNTGAEIVAGSTRLGAATAQKTALNMISVLAGISLGHVHDGYMVNLTADNMKLVERAIRIVTATTGCDTECARQALALSDGAVKPAILIALGQSPENAVEALSKTKGRLGPLLDNNS